MTQPKDILDEMEQEAKPKKRKRSTQKEVTYKSTNEAAMSLPIEQRAELCLNLKKSIITEQHDIAQRAQALGELAGKL